MVKKLIGKLIFLACFVLVFSQKLKSQKSLITKRSQLQHEFQKFKKTYVKSYNSQEEEAYRFNVFLESFKEVDRLNQEIPSAQFGVTQFSDYTKEEFLNLFANSSTPTDLDQFDSFLQNTSETDSQVQTSTTLPSQWDIRVNGPGKLQPVKNEGYCGSGWAFAVTSTIENLYSTTNQNFSFSEQQLIDCTLGQCACSATGVPINQIYNYIQQTGLAISNFYPQQAFQGCGTCHPQKAGYLYKIKGFVHLQFYNIQEALVNKGAIAIYVNSKDWQYYQKGILRTGIDGVNSNKISSLIGYGPNYWLLRNSCGTNWGEQGYIRVANDGRGGIDLNLAYQPYL